MQYTREDALCQRLDDPRFAWREKKAATYRLAHLYDLAGYRRYGDRAAACAGRLGFAVAEVDAETGETQPRRTLRTAAFCGLRLCPMCAARRARRAAILLSRVLDEAQRREAGLQYVFLTLTVRNVEGDRLAAGLNQLTQGWGRLCKQRGWRRAVRGWFRALEITRNPADSTYHPHIHAILAVPDGYWRRSAGLYITHPSWVERWRAALRVDYSPSVRIASTRDRGGRRSTAAAAAEAAKYVTKSSDWSRMADEGVAAEIVGLYTRVLHHRRLCAYGGLLRQVARQVGADDLEAGDLVHMPDEAARGDLIELMEIYGWRWGGVRDYVLEEVQHMDVSFLEASRRGPT